MTGHITAETDNRYGKSRSRRASACRSGRRRSAKRNAAASSPLIMLLTVLLCVAALLTLSGFTPRRAPEEEGGWQRYYSAVSVQRGDTLWSIASEHCGGPERSVRSIVKEIRTINDLSSDTIQYGQYLLVPCFERAGQDLSE